MKEKIKLILQDLLDIKKSLRLDNLSDDVIFDAAIRILNTSKMNPEKKEEKKGKPTQKQLDFLIKNNYNGDIDSLSFEEAKQLISEFIGAKR